MRDKPGSDKREIAPNNDRELRRKSILRWCIAVLLSFAILGALSISYRFSGNSAQGISDELLAFELTPAHPTVVLTVPGGIPEIELTTWGASPPLDELDPHRVFRYEFSVSFFSRKGEKVLERVFEPETKITIDPAAPAYRIFGESDWIADPRTVSIPLGKFLQDGGTAKIELRSTELSGVLLRPVHREPRSPYERVAFEKSFRTDAMQRLARGKQSLGFADLSSEQKELYLSRWGRRLDATGNEKRDFFLRRLLLSDNIKKPRIAPSTPPEVVTEEQWIAINLHGAARLSFDANGPLEVVGHPNLEAPLPLQPQKVSESGQPRWSLEDGNNQPHSLFLRAKKGSVAFRMYIASDARARMIGPPTPPPLTPEFEISPDTHRQPLIQLDPISPVRFHVSTGQELLRLEVRGFATRPLREEQEDTVTLRWKLGGKEEVRPVRVRLMRSPFETLGESKSSPRSKSVSASPPADRGTAATLAYPLQLRIPPGVTEIDVLGPAHLLATASVVDPFQQEDILQAPYRVPLQEDEAWRFAPYEVHRWVPVRPDNFAELLFAKRDRTLLAQTRIEKKGAFFRGKGSRGLERPLAAVGNPYARHFFEPGLLSPENALPQDGWTVFREEARVRVEASGPRGGELLLRYATTSGMLGKEMRWSLDKDIVRTTPVSLRSGETRLQASPGFHRIGVDAPKEDVVVWVNAAPAQEGMIVREKTVYETTSLQDIGFRIDRRSEKPTTLALTIVTSELKGAYALSYIIDGGRPRTQVGIPFHRSTEPIGILRGGTGQGGGAFVEGADDLFQPSLLQRGIAKAKIRLGDDLGKGLHEIRFRSLTPGKTWVRLTLIGEADDTFASESRAWLDDE